MNDMALSAEQSRQLFEEHSPYVYSIALMMTKSSVLADDITQETFLRAFQKFHLYDPSRPLRPWLYRMTVNMVRSALRKQRWLTLFGQIPTEEKSTRCLEELVVQTERERELWQAVQGLTDKRKEVIILHYYAGLPLQEVAAILNIRPGTCKSRLHAALQQLRTASLDAYSFASMKEGTP